MTYPDLTFPTRPGQPFLYSNFVQTLDGKTQVLHTANAYWPIGSATDYATLLELRAYADVLIHGKNTALAARAVDSLGKPEFQEMRTRLGKGSPIVYAVCSAHPSEELRAQLTNPPAGVQPILLTTEDAVKFAGVEQIICGAADEVDPVRVYSWLQEQGFQTVLHEGGPHLFGSFIQAGYIEELFLTLAPTVVGNRPGATLTMAENGLLPADQLARFTLVSSKAIENEVYLRYRRQA